MVQAGSVNAWAHFQAKRTKKRVAESILDQPTVERKLCLGLKAEVAALRDSMIEIGRAKLSRYEGEKQEVKVQAEAYEKQYVRLNVHDDRRDIAEAAINITVAALGVAALTRRRWLVGLALTFAGVGLASGLAGFAGGDFRLPLSGNIPC